MGAQDMKRKPTVRELERFLYCLSNALNSRDGAKYFGTEDAAVQTFNQYHDVIVVQEWLQALVRGKGESQ